MASKKHPPPFFVPRQIMEWKRQPDLTWTQKTGLGRYYTLLEGKVNIQHCREFVTSNQQQPEDEQFPSGIVEGVLVQYSSRYLHKFFGWDGLGATEWSPACTQPEPDLTPYANIAKKDGRYDIFALGQVLKDPWFARMRGLLSQVYFQNNCNGILPAQLSLLLLADKGEQINWGLLLEENFKVQLRGYRRNPVYSSPIGPFLSAYITHFLSFHKRNNQPPIMGTFLDVQREIAAAAAQNSTPPGPSKRPRLVSPSPARDIATPSTWGPHTMEFHAKRTAVADCMEAMFQFVHGAEQEHRALTSAHKDFEDRLRRKATETIQAAQIQAEKRLAAAQLEHHQQNEETKQTLHNLREHVKNLENELTATQEHVDTLTKEKTILVDRTKTLEAQSAEARARCKALVADNTALKQTSGVPSINPEALSRLQQDRIAVEQAQETFEANKAGWVHNAANLIATCAFEFLRSHPPVTEAPPMEYLNHCIDSTLAALDLEQSERDWETTDMDMDLMCETLGTSLPMSITPQTLPEVSPPTEVVLDPGSSSGPSWYPMVSAPGQGFAHAEQDHQGEPGNPEERVDIPDHLTDIEETPQHSPRPAPPQLSPRMPQLQGSPSQPTVPFRPKPFKFHKDALKKIEEEHNLEVQASDESEAEEELDLAISEVRKYFLNNADLVAIYSNPESDQVQCSACNKILGKTVYDVYQHAVTSRSKHNLIHRGVAAAIATLHGGQAPPRKQMQVPREATRPDRRPAHRRTRG